MDEPPPPDLRVLDVNIRGVMYTAHLTMYYLPKNPGSVAADPKCGPSQLHLDRHLVLISSMAGIYPIPGQALYGASNHVVVGFYQWLHSTGFMHGISQLDVSILHGHRYHQF